MNPYSFDAPEGERLSKVLARLGYGSRRVCDELIASGRVRVNGEVATLGVRVDTGSDEVTVDGAPVGIAPDLVYYLLNKPAKVVTTASDPEGRATVMAYVPDEPRVFPVGRLDYDTEGLLILTNDGPLTQLLTHPSHGVEKEYLAELDGTPSHGELSRLRKGITLDDGPTAEAKVGVVGDRTVRITIHEGRNRQVRRMFDAIGFEVRRLVRIRIGPLTDSTLAPGAYRPLSTDEVLALREAATPRLSRAERRRAAYEGDGLGRETH
jgi:23S rRNA pseudouridine2605 synthase